mgnify:CR=1 FL=1
MEEKIIEIKEILLKINNLNNEISYLDTLIIKYEKEIDKQEEKINNYTFNIRDKINYLHNEKKEVQERRKNLEKSKKKLRQKIVLTLLTIICLLSLLVVNNKTLSIIFLLTSILGSGSIVLNILSNKKQEKELNKYNIEEINSSIEKAVNNLDEKNNKKLKPLFEKKEKVSVQELLLRKERIVKKKELIHLKKERDNRYKELFEVMEDEVKLSNSEIEGQLEIPGIKKVRNR